MFVFTNIEERVVCEEFVSSGAIIQQSAGANTQLSLKRHKLFHNFSFLDTLVYSAPFLPEKEVGDGFEDLLSTHL